MMLTARPILVSALALSGAAGASAHAQEPPERCIDATSVEEVYPRADAVPENLLRFYIYFSQPMARDDVAAAVTLRDGEGAVLSGVFLPTRYPLWSPDGRRLTLILDPGRVKTGLQAHEAMGRALIAGDTLTLSVEASVRDDRGCSLASEFRKTFAVVAADGAHPTVGNWGVTAPRVGTREPLVVVLDGAYDHLSLAYRVRVQDESGGSVGGAIDLTNEDTHWVFTPAEPWREATYAIAVDPMLEDLAGNRPTGVFDRAPDDDRGEADRVERRFFTPTSATSVRAGEPSSHDVTHLNENGE